MSGVKAACFFLLPEMRGGGGLGLAEPGCRSQRGQRLPPPPRPSVPLGSQRGSHRVVWGRGCFAGLGGGGGGACRATPGAEDSPGHALAALSL